MSDAYYDRVYGDIFFKLLERDSVKVLINRKLDTGEKVSSFAVYESGVSVEGFGSGDVLHYLYVIKHNRGKGDAIGMINTLNNMGIRFKYVSFMTRDFNQFWKGDKLEYCPCLRSKK